MNLKKKVDNKENTGYTGKPDISEEVPWSTEGTPVPGMYKEQEACTGKREEDKVWPDDCKQSLGRQTINITEEEMQDMADRGEMALVKADPKKTVYNLINEVSRLQVQIQDANKLLQMAYEVLKVENRESEAYIPIFNYLNNRNLL